MKDKQNNKNNFFFNICFLLIIKYIFENIIRSPLLFLNTLKQFVLLPAAMPPLQGEELTLLLFQGQVMQRIYSSFPAPLNFLSTNIFLP
jgi:hypothetical protein